MIAELGKRILPVDVFAIANFNDKNEKLIVLDFVNDAIVTNFMNMPHLQILVQKGVVRQYLTVGW